MRVALVNDLPLVVEVLRRVVTSLPEHAVAWTAGDGVEAVEMCRRDTPDVVLMDLLMPRMNGAEATRIIMQECPCAILVVTATVAGNFTLVCEALGNGAYDAVCTPQLGGRPPAEAGADLLRKLAAVDRINRRIRAARPDAAASPAGEPPRPTAGGPSPPLVAIGASTGGPQAIDRILARLPADLPAAVLIVQHIGADFADSLAHWLNDRTPLAVRLARDGDKPEAGQALIADGSRHLVMGPDGRLRYTSQPCDDPYCPSVDVLFRSLVNCRPQSSVAVLLTGIGRDGAVGLLALSQAGWHTIAQSEQSCIVNGMPQAARELGAARENLPPEEIATSILRRLKHVGV